MTTRRLGELGQAPIPDGFDAQRLQAIHRFIFQDVYPWAGKFRTVNISRFGQFPFALAEFIIPSIDKVSADLKGEHYLGNLGVPKFCIRAAHYMARLTPFTLFGTEMEGRSVKSSGSLPPAIDTHSIGPAFRAAKWPRPRGLVFNTETMRVLRRFFGPLLISDTPVKDTAAEV